MNLFTQHPYEQGVTYAEHWQFAMAIAWRMFRSVLAFAVHAMMPFVSIKRHLDLEATAAYLGERNRFIAAAAMDSRTHRSATPVRAPAYAAAKQQLRLIGARGWLR